MAVYYFIITNVRYGTTTSDTTCTRINNDCSGWTTWLYRYKKKKKNQEVPGPVWIPMTHFVIPQKHHISDISGQRGVWNPRRTSRHLSGGYSKTSLKWRQGTEDLSLLKRCWWAPSHFFFFCFVFLLSLFFLKRRRLTITALEEGRREGMLVMYSNGANSAGHLAIYKVVLRYQWDMLALEGHHLHIQGTWSITNRYMLE